MNDALIFLFMKTHRQSEKLAFQYMRNKIIKERKIYKKRKITHGADDRLDGANFLSIR